MRIVMAHSFKGGSGKTIFTSNLAHILADQGQKVLLIETDFAMPAFQSIYDGLEPDMFLNNFLDSSSTDLVPYVYQHPAQANLDLVFCDEVFNPSHKVFGRDQNWFQLKKLQLEKSLAKLDYDVIIFDTTPGNSLFVINLLLLTDYVFLILRSDKQSIRGTQLLIERIYKKTVDLGGNVKLNLVINQIPKVEEMKAFIEEQRQKFKFTYDFIQNVLGVSYEHQTSYLTVFDQFILPEGNPTLAHIRLIAESADLL